MAKRLGIYFASMRSRAHITSMAGRDEAFRPTMNELSR